MTRPALPLRKNQEIEITIDRLALGGKGVGHLDGMVVFVDGALPGDHVRARVTRRRTRFAEARTIEKLVIGSPRVDPRCTHFRDRECGGCRFQDLPYQLQVEAKETQVRETLAHLGAVVTPQVHAITPCPEPFHYRNKMEFSFLPDRQNRVLLGLHRRYRFDQVFPLEECWICSPLTSEIVRFTARFAREQSWPAYHPVAHTGLVRFLVVRHLPLSDQVMVNLVAADEEIPALEGWGRGIAELDSRIRSVVLNINTTRANVATGDPARQQVLHGSRFIEERLLGLEFQVSANTFLQTNSRQAEPLYRAVLEEAALTGEERVLDVYCGAGTITLALARNAREVFGIEIQEDAVLEARHNAEHNGIDNVSFEAGEARKLLRHWEKPWRPDVVVVDPPRAGLHDKVVGAISALHPRRLIYVSCNPATLARDVGSFAESGYRLKHIRPFDLFPHTPHIECVAHLYLGDKDKLASGVGPEIA